PSARSRTGHRGGCGRPPACAGGCPPGARDPFSWCNPPPRASLTRRRGRTEGPPACRRKSISAVPWYGVGWRGQTPLGTLRDLACALRSAGRRSDGDDAVADRVLDQVRRGLESEGLQDAGLVELGRSGRDLQNGRHLLGGTALGEELQDFPLTRGELVRWVVQPGIPF